MTFRTLPALPATALIVVLAGCATYEPLPYGEVVTMKAGEAASVSGYPPPGTVWRLDESDMRVLSPAPTVSAPPSPVYYPPPPPPGWPYGPPTQ